METCCCRCCQSAAGHQAAYALWPLEVPSEGTASSCAGPRSVWPHPASWRSPSAAHTAVTGCRPSATNCGQTGVAQAVAD